MVPAGRNKISEPERLHLPALSPPQGGLARNTIRQKEFITSPARPETKPLWGRGQNRNLPCTIKIIPMHQKRNIITLCPDETILSEMSINYILTRSLLGCG